MKRHPLPETGTDSVEKAICHVVSLEHAVVLQHIQDETQKDTQVQKLSERISRGDWEQYRQDSNIIPFNSIKHELYSINGLIFNLNQIVVPTRLQRKVVRAAHHLGHVA